MTEPPENTGRIQVSTFTEVDRVRKQWKLQVEDGWIDVYRIGSLGYPFRVAFILTEGAQPVWQTLNAYPITELERTQLLSTARDLWNGWGV